MLSGVIGVLILLGLVVHRYLTVFQENGILPYSMGHSTVSALFAIVYLISLVWMLGIIGGIVVAALCFLQVVQSCVLWVFSLPWIIKMFSARIKPAVNPIIYGAWPFLVGLVAVLTIVNFFASEYAYIWNQIAPNLLPVSIIAAAVILVGNLIRIPVLRAILKTNRVDHVGL